MKRAPGQLFTGTSGFAYPGWSPRFYPPGLTGGALLPAYAARLPAVELHSTFYRRPDAATVARWLGATPETFRFCPKAQRGAAWRAWAGDHEQSTEALAWLASSLSTFGVRLGAVLLSASSRLVRDDAALARLLEVRPAGLPLALELPHPSWTADEVHAQLARHGVALVATDLDEGDEPDLRRLGPFLYVRLRRAGYPEASLSTWAARLRPFLDDGLDAYVFFRHDVDGTAALLAEELLARCRAGSG